MDLFDPRSSHPEAEEVHTTSKSRVFRIRDSEGAGRDACAAFKASPPDGTLFLKEEPYGFPAILQGLTTRPRVTREFENLLALRSLGCPAVEPLAHGASGCGPFYRRSFLITAEFPRAQTLKEWSRNPSGRVPGGRDVNAALLGFARILGRLHREGCYFRTLYAKNLLVRQADSGGAELSVCDMPRLWRRAKQGAGGVTSRLGWIDFAMACFDLASLDKWGACVCSRRERLRFLNVYLKEVRIGPPKRTWVRWAGLLSRHLRHETHLGKFRKKFRRRLVKYGLNKYWPF